MERGIGPLVSCRSTTRHIGVSDGWSKNKFKRVAAQFPPSPAAYWRPCKATTSGGSRRPATIILYGYWFARSAAAD